MKKGFKVTIVIAILLFLSLGIYTFAAPDDEPELLDGGKTQNVNGKKEEKYDNNGKENTLEEPAAEAEEETNEEELNIPVRRDNVVNNNEVQRAEQENVNEVQNEPKVEEKEIEKDETAPLLTLNGEKTLTVKEGQEYTELGATMTDNVDETITDLQPVSIHYSVNGVFKGAVDSIDTSKVGTYKISYKYTDAAGNAGVDATRADHNYVMRIVEVLDATAPKLTLNGEKTITLEVGVDTYNELGASMADNVDDAVTDLQPVQINYSVDGKFKGSVNFVDTTKMGMYKIVYKYTDAAGNAGVDANRADHNYVMRIVNVVDTTAPVVNIEDGSFFNTDVEVEITEDNFEKVTIGGIEYTTKNITITEEGNYTLVAVDKAGNSKTVKFTIDKTKATINVPNDGYKKNGENLVITEENLDYVNVYLNFATTPVKYTTKEITLDKEGTYKIVIYDKAGNEVTYWSHVDNTEPVIEVSSEYTNENITLTVKDRYLKSVKVNDKTYTRNDFSADGHNENYVLNVTLEEEGVYEITAVDKAGHEVTKTVEIDRTAPERVGLNVVGGSGIWENKVYYMYAKVGTRVDIYASFAEKLGTNPTVTLNGIEAGTMSVTSVKDGVYKYYLGVKLTNENVVGDGLLDIRLTNYADTLGNVGRELVMATDGTLGSQKNIIIDRTAPVVEGIDKEYTNEDVVLTITDTNLKTVTVNSETKELNENTLTLTDEGKYVVIATDKSGNATTKEFTIDKTSAKVTSVYVYAAKGGKKTTDTGYVFNGENIHIRFKTNEELGTNPTVTVKNGEGTLTLTATKASENLYDASYSVNDNIVDGKVEFTVSGIEDKAGNTTADVSKITNGSWLAIDRVAPEVENVTVSRNIEKDFNVNIEFSEIVSKVNEESYNSKNITIVMPLGEGKVTFADKAGNKNEISLTVEDTNLPENEFVIYSAEELMTFAANAKNYKNKTLMLGRDIDLSGKEWTPIDGWDGNLNGMVFDGNGYSIKNLTITDSEDEAVGFIGRNASSVTIKNLTFDGAKVSQKKAKTRYAGVLIGKNYSTSTFENINVINSEVKNNWQTGGIIGFAEEATQTFKNCHVENTFVGGESATAGILYGLGIANVVVEGCTSKDVDLYTDSLTWESALVKFKSNWAGHVYHAKGYKVTVTDSTEENTRIVAMLPSELANIFANGTYLEGNTVVLGADMDMSDTTWTPAENVGFVLDGANHTISNLKYAGTSNAGAFLTHIGNGKKVTIKNITLDKANITSSSTSYAAAVGGFVGTGDTAGDITILNSTIKNSNIALPQGDGYAGGFVGYTAGWNKVNDGPVYATVTIDGCSLLKSTVTATSSAGGAVAHAGANADTTTTVSNFTAKNNTITGEKEAKTGIVIGTANVGKAIINNTTSSNNTVFGVANSTKIYGRVALGDTGSLTIDGVNITE